MSVSAAETTYPTTINSQSVQSFDYNGKPIIPIRDLENFGFLVEWNSFENRVYLSRPYNQVTDFFTSGKTYNSSISYMYPTMTPKGNIETFSMNGNGYMYFEDLSKFGTINGYSATLNNATIFVSPDPTDQREYIKGGCIVSKDIAKEWARSKGATDLFIMAADYYWEYAVYTGIRAEVLYAQAAFETGFGTYKGNVVPSQNNFAGIKKKNATGDRTYDHESFATQRDGVRGHFNHMLAYVGGTPIGEVHGRYYSVKSMPWAGTVKLVNDLSGKWCPRSDYAKTIIKFLDEMYNFGM
jgi:hypothetical protein